MTNIQRNQETNTALQLATIRYNKSKQILHYKKKKRQEFLSWLIISMIHNVLEEEIEVAINSNWNIQISNHTWMTTTKLITKV